MWFVIGFSLLLCIMFLWFTYYRLTVLIININYHQKQLNIGLEKRFKALASLIQVIKNFNKEEPELERILLLHNQSTQAKLDNKERQRIQVENQITDITTKLPYIYAQYPELNSNLESLQIKKNIMAIEKNLMYAKAAYQDSVAIYNAAKNEIPTSLLISLFQNLNKEFDNWQLTASLCRR